MNTSFLEVYETFLSKIRDFTILELEDEDVKSWCYKFMVSAIVKINPIKNTFTFDKELEEFNSPLLPIEIELIAIQMVAEWVEPQLNNTALVKQFIGTKDERFFAQANQIDKLQSMLQMEEARQKSLRRDYGYRNFNPTKVG